MDRINKIGRMLINYKDEYSKHYSPIVDDSLMFSLEIQLEKKVLSKELYNMILDDNISLVEFEKTIGNMREYIKSEKELLAEFEKVRAIVNEGLVNANFTKNIETESNLEINRISILKQYTITEEFIKIYFGLEDEDLPIIMKKKGFAEKFAVLRLTKIFKEIFAEIRPEVEFTQGFSRVYYNNEVNGFSVDYKYHLPVDYITRDNIRAKIDKIRSVDRAVEKKFNNKTGINSYNMKSNEKENTSLDVSKQAPNNKFSEVKIEETEIKKIKEEIINTEEKIETKENKLSNTQNNRQEQPKQENKKEQEKVRPQENKIVKQEQSNKKENKTEQQKKNNIDYLGNNLDNEESVMEIISEVADANITVEEDNSDDFGDFLDGFVPSEEIDLDADDIAVELEIDDLPDESFFGDIEESMDFANNLNDMEDDEI